MKRPAEEALFAEWERAQVTLNSIGDDVLSTDMQGNVTYLNAVAEAMTSWPLADEQLALLLTQRCDEAQGYLFGCPVPAGEIARTFAHRAHGPPRLRPV